MSCKEIGCDSQILARELCTKHYQQMRMATMTRTCTVDDCSQLLFARKMCRNHYFRCRYVRHPRLTLADRMAVGQGCPKGHAHSELRTIARSRGGVECARCRRDCRKPRDSSDSRRYYDNLRARMESDPALRNRVRARRSRNNREYRAAHQSEISQYMKQYYAERRLDPAWLEHERRRARVKERQRMLNLETRERAREQQRLHRLANINEYKRIDNSYYQENREYILRRNQQWRDERKGSRTGAWTAHEDSIVMRDDISLTEMCFMLDRSYGSVGARRNSLKKLPKLTGTQPLSVTE